ncbi:hypothetical protein KP509_05G068300 [Ceratopteris richardii]|uniref:Uncharacterized protein n=1 Tax=Ceratopteris richardii TaxID=49495 RepID=A0A8T2UVB2_CERRI|nr:hypothetical protein KP509_05G068300 [Ceratopteris richardii]
MALSRSITNDVNSSLVERKANCLDLASIGGVYGQTLFGSEKISQLNEQVQDMFGLSDVPRVLVSGCKCLHLWVHKVCDQWY